MFSSSAASAHGVEARMDGARESVPAVHFSYSDGSPVSYASVTIWSPEDESIEYQNGRTDKNGQFSFLPDSTGVWRISVNDGQGHAATLSHDVADLDTAVGTGAAGKERSSGERLLLALFGTSLIMNLGFALSLYRKKAEK